MTRVIAICGRVLRVMLAITLAFTGIVVGSSVKSPKEAVAATGSFAQVDNSKIFCEGYYLNQQGKFQDPSFQLGDFTTYGGKVVPLAPSTNERANIYTTSNIGPNLLGLEDASGVPAWGFIPDETFNDAGTAARGAYIEMTYAQVGTLESASDESFKPITVDIRVRYTVLGTITPEEAARKGAALGFKNNAVIQFTDCFGYGTFQFGVTAMDTTYTFLNSNTHQLVDIDSIYYTKTSMDKGEGFSVDAELVKRIGTDPGAYVSKGAPLTKSDPNIADDYRFDAIPGSFLYYGAHSPFERNGIGFSGVPEIHDKQGKRYDYDDTIGAPTYYWRSASVLLDMQDKSSVTITVCAAGSRTWTNGWDIPNGESNLGSMYQTANFIPLTNPRPRVPLKTINHGTDTVSGVRLNDTVHYEIAQKVGSFGQTSVAAYESMIYTDPLPEYVKYVEGSGRMIDPDGVEVPADAGTIAYDPTSNTLTYTFSPDFLLNGMKYRGGTYTLAFDAIAVDQPERDFDQPLSDNNGDGLFTDGTQGRLDDHGGAGTIGRVPNQSTVAINGYAQTSNIVYYEPVEPVLDIEKHADLTTREVSPVNDYQYLSADEGNPNSTVRFVGSLKDIIDRTRAKNITVFDKLPAGLSLVAGTVKLSGFDGADTIRVEESESGWSAVIPQLDAWADVNFSYECTTSGDGNGHEVVNTIHAWATNCALDSPGGENSHETDDGEIYINDPNLVVHKTVAASPIQNDDYQATDENDREEYRVGDVFEYTVTLENDIPGTFGHNVWLVDEEMPAEFALEGNIVVTGVDYNDQGKSFAAPAAGSCEIAKYPYTGNTNVGINSDGVHGETKYVTSSFGLVRQSYSDGNWGWALHVDYLPCGQKIIVKWSVKALEGANGWEVYNQAFAKAGNQPNNRFESEEPVVWINSPNFEVDKHVTKTQDTYSVGDNAKYQVELFGLKTPGTLARKTTLQDILRTEGVVINELSDIKVYDQRANSNSIAEQVDLYACEDPMLVDEDGAETSVPAWHQGERLRYDDGSDQNWHIDISQVYEDDGYWVCDYDYRFVWKDGKLGRVDEERNPVKVDGYSDPDGEGNYSLSWDRVDHKLTNYSYMRVEYEATINDHALENLLMINDATANSIEQIPVTDRASITVIGAHLDITKGSNDNGTFTVGQVVDYEIAVTNLTSDTTATDVQITDSFTTAKAGSVEIVDGSVELVTDTGIPVGIWTIAWRDNEAGSHIGFTIDTNIDLEGGHKIIVRYKVKHLSDNGSTYIENTAKTWADNAPEVRAKYKTKPRYEDEKDPIKDKDEVLRPLGTNEPSIDKIADKEVVRAGETVHYTVVVRPGKEGLSNAKVVDVRDERLSLVEDSLVVNIEGANAPIGLAQTLSEPAESEALNLFATPDADSASSADDAEPTSGAEPAYDTEPADDAGQFPQEKISINSMEFPSDIPYLPNSETEDASQSAESAELPADVNLFKAFDSSEANERTKGFWIGSLSIGQSAIIEYDCIVSPDVQSGIELPNTATLTADEIDDISDTTLVRTEGTTLLKSLGSALGAPFGKTGDETIGAIGLALIAATVAALVAFVLRRVHVRRLPQADQSTRQDGSHARS